MCGIITTISIEWGQLIHYSLKQLVHFCSCTKEKQLVTGFGARVKYFIFPLKSYSSSFHCMVSIILCCPADSSEMWGMGKCQCYERSFICVICHKSIITFKKYPSYSKSTQTRRKIKPNQSPVLLCWHLRCKWSMQGKIFTLTACCQQNLWTLWHFKCPYQNQSWCGDAACHMWSAVKTLGMRFTLYPTH